MSSPLRLPPIAPPPLPAFLRARPGTLTGSAASRVTPGFSLALEQAKPVNSTKQATIFNDLSRRLGVGCQPVQEETGATAQTAIQSDAVPLSDRISGTLVNQVKNVDAMQTRAKSIVHAQTAGDHLSDTEMLTAAQKADLAFHLLIEIRNKLMDAFREVQQIHI